MRGNGGVGEWGKVGRGVGEWRGSRESGQNGGLLGTRTGKDSISVPRGQTKPLRDVPLQIPNQEGAVAPGTSP